MSRSHSIPTLLVALALPAAAVVPGPAYATAPAPRLLRCGGAPLLRPTGTVVLSCADANSEIKSTHWRSWGAKRAVGTTDFGLNLCTPTCAASRISFFPHSSVQLMGVKATSKGRLFSRAVIIYTRNGKRKTFTAYPET